MSMEPGWRRAFRLPLIKRRVEREVDDELSFHMAMREEALRGAGLSADAARVEARRRFGDVSVVRGDCLRIDQARARRERAATVVTDFAQDLAFAARSLRRAPAFTAIALLTLGVGIGAAVAIFSIAYSVLLRPLAFPRSDQLVQLSAASPRTGVASMGLSSPEYLDLVGTRAFVDAGAMSLEGLTISGAGQPERVHGAGVTASLFRTLGVRAAVGRVFSPEEDRPGADNVIVLSDALWRRRFGGAPEVVGTTVRVDGTSRIILGVLPSDARVENVDAFIPLALDPAHPRPRGAHYLTAIARLREGASLDGARSELAALAVRSRTDYPEMYADASFTMTASPLRDAWVGDARATLRVLLAAVSLLLLIACVNVANLLLVRAEMRQREIAVRVALGASRGRLIRQLLAEVLLLATAGAALGLPIAALGARALLVLNPGMIPPGVNVSIDRMTVVVAAALIGATALLAGLVPSFQAASLDVRSAIAGGGMGGGRRGGRLRAALVTAEFAVSAMVLIGAVLVGRSFWRLQAVDPGFRRGGVLSMDVALPPARYPDAERVPPFYARLLERLRALPGVHSAAVVSNLPLSGNAGTWLIEVEGRATTPGAPLPSPNFVIVSADYFRTIDVPIRGGRAFTAIDGAKTPPVVVVSTAMAKTIWPSGDPLGSRIRLSAGGEQHPVIPWMEVIGIAGDVRSEALGAESRPTYYLLDTQFPALLGDAQRGMTVLVRGKGDVRPLGGAVRQSVWSLDADLAISNLRPLDDVIVGAVARPRFAAVVLTAFGIAALTLAVIGVYGVLSHAISRRRREIGIRMALGAQAAEVRRMVLGEGMRLAVAGVAIGAAGAVAGSRMLSAVLYEVSSTDPATIGGAAMTLLLAALVASYLPARRAMRVDPVEALRE